MDFNERRHNVPSLKIGRLRFSLYRSSRPFSAMIGVSLRLGMWGELAKGWVDRFRLGTKLIAGFR